MKYLTLLLVSLIFVACSDIPLQNIHINPDSDIPQFPDDISDTDKVAGFAIVFAIQDYQKHGLDYLINKYREHKGLFEHPIWIADSDNTILALLDDPRFVGLDFLVALNILDKQLAEQVPNTPKNEWLRYDVQNNYKVVAIWFDDYLFMTYYRIEL